MSDSLAEQVAKAFGDRCSCGYKRFILLRGVFKWKWCTRCDGIDMPDSVVENEVTDE